MGEYQSKKQFIRFLNIAKGSSGELRSQLYVSLDAEYIHPLMMKELKEQTTSISKQCYGLIKYLEGYDGSDIVRESDEEDFLVIINKFYE